MYKDTKNTFSRIFFFVKTKNILFIFYIFKNTNKKIQKFSKKWKLIKKLIDLSRKLFLFLSFDFIQMKKNIKKYSSFKSINENIEPLHFNTD